MYICMNQPPQSYIAMEKKYPQPEDIEMETDEDLYPQPPLTEEELKNALTGDQVIKLWQEQIEKRFSK